MQIVHRPSVLCSFVLAVLCVGLPRITAEAVQHDVRLSKTPLYPGLSDTTDLTAVLPSLPFVLSEQLETEAAGRCFDPQNDDECAKTNSTWSVFQATYSDNSDSPVYVCVCQGSPFEAHGFADTFSHVSTTFTFPTCMAVACSLPVQVLLGHDAASSWALLLLLF